MINFQQYWIKDKDHPLPGFDFIPLQISFSKWKTEKGRMRFWHIVLLNFGATIKLHKND